MKVVKIIMSIFISFSLIISLASCSFFPFFNNTTGETRGIVQEPRENSNYETEAMEQESAEVEEDIIDQDQDDLINEPVENDSLNNPNEDQGKTEGSVQLTFPAGHQTSDNGSISYFYSEDGDEVVKSYLTIYLNSELFDEGMPISESVRDLDTIFYDRIEQIDGTVIENSYAINGISSRKDPTGAYGFVYITSECVNDFQRTLAFYYEIIYEPGPGHFDSLTFYNDTLTSIIYSMEVQRQ